MSSELTPLLLLVVLLVVFWLVVLRPARNQQRTQQALQRSLEVGDDVVLSAGIFGTVTAIEDTQVHLEVAPGTVVRVARQVVVRRVEDEAASPAVADGEAAPASPEIVADEHPQPVEVTSAWDGVEGEDAGTAAEEPTLEPDGAETEEAAATRTAAKKTAAKKTAKKTTAKKTTAKKSAPKREDAERG